MNKKKLLPIGVLIVALMAGAFVHHQKRAKATLTQNLFGREESREPIKNPKVVKACRLRHLEGSPYGSDVLEDYVKDEDVRISPEQAAGFRDILQNPNSYVWNSHSAKGCVLDYGVLLSFESPPKTVRVALCFNCLILGVYSGTNRGAVRIGRGDFDPARNQLAGLVKSIFPNDPQIQAIPY